MNNELLAFPRTNLAPQVYAQIAASPQIPILPPYALRISEASSRIAITSLFLGVDVMLSAAPGHLLPEWFTKPRSHVCQKCGAFDARQKGGVMFSDTERLLVFDGPPLGPGNLALISVKNESVLPGVFEAVLYSGNSAVQMGAEHSSVLTTPAVPAARSCSRPGCFTAMVQDQASRLWVCKNIDCGAVEAP